MNQRPSEQPWQPDRAHLVAYVDGALDARTKRALDNWLRLHPDVAAELQSHERLARLCDLTAPLMPSNQQWSDVRQRIADGAAKPRPPIPGRSRRWYATRVLGVAAASVALALLLFRLASSSGTAHLPKLPDQLTESRSTSEIQHLASHTAPLVRPQQAPVVLAVLTPDEIEITSMDLRDRMALVVGDPPLRDTLVLLTTDEVSVQNVERASAERKPEFTAEPTPMLWVPKQPDR